VTHRVQMVAVRMFAAALVAGSVLAFPAGAAAHAYLVKTVPAASVVLSAPPPSVQLTFDEAVEPRFAIISVTDVAAQQETVGPVQRAAGNPDTLVVPLRRGLPEGWYLIYWRAISVDGHPVQGAFTYAVGPDPGPAPEFRVPNIAAGATVPQLLVTRWLVFVTTMAAIGLLVLRLLVVRPLARSLPEVSMRAVSVAFVGAAVLGLIAIPVYLDLSIANDSLRSVFDLPDLVPLYGATAFSRGILDLWLCFALFCLAGGVALWLDRPARAHRSVAELAAGVGAGLAGAAVLVVPGASGHAAQTSPRGLTLLFDWLHMASGALWIGGLLGLLVLAGTVPAKRRTAALAVCVPRFSNLALGSVIVLALSGAGEAVDHLPAIAALWQTGYGEAILVKTGLLAGALVLAAGNLLRSRPQLLAVRQRPELGVPASRLMGRLVAGEALLVVGILFAAAVLSSLAPPPPAFALEGSALATVGPGTVARTVQRAGYTLEMLISPNRAAAPDTFALRVSRGGAPVRGANVTVTFNHTEMQMPTQEYQLAETSPGLYTRSAPALVMVGRWALTFQITPRSALPVTVLILDQANG
jgi:copper transport protein